jgi:hypothetical protein
MVAVTAVKAAANLKVAASPKEAVVPATVAAGPRISTSNIKNLQHIMI